MKKVGVFETQYSRSLLYLRRFSPPCLLMLLCNLSMICLLFHNKPSIYARNFHSVTAQKLLIVVAVVVTVTQVETDVAV